MKSTGDNTFLDFSSPNYWGNKSCSSYDKKCDPSFSTTKSDLPKKSVPTLNWNNVPPLYLTIQNYVTHGNTKPPDTNLLYPILLSSGLQRDSLARLWDLANQAIPGQLNIQELYILLSLIAQTQAGQTVMTSNICTFSIPHLQLACPPPPVSQAMPQYPQNIIPSMNTISLLQDDDFDDFQSAAPSSSSNTWEFSDFQQSLPVTSNQTPPQAAKQPPLNLSSASNTTNSNTNTFNFFGGIQEPKQQFSSASNIKPLNAPASSANSDHSKEPNKPEPTSLFLPAPNFRKNTKPAFIPPSKGFNPNFLSKDLDLLGDLSSSSSQPSKLSHNLTNIPTIHSSCVIRDPKAPVIPKDNPSASNSNVQAQQSLDHPPSSGILPSTTLFKTGPSDQDKYSCFRSIDLECNTSAWTVEKEEEDDFGDFIDATSFAGATPEIKAMPSPISLNFPMQSLTTNKPSPTNLLDFTFEEPVIQPAPEPSLPSAIKVEDEDDDDFADFLSSTPSFPLESTSAPSVNKPLPQPSSPPFSQTFANFESQNFDIAPLPSFTLTDPEPQKINPPKPLFGRISPPLPTFSNPIDFENKQMSELFDRLSTHATSPLDSKQECQSVSSLELDFPLSSELFQRHDSLPSLDLKPTQQSPSSLSSANKLSSDEDASPIANLQTFPSNVDKYSCIRLEDEQYQDEDKHVAAWVKCLESCCQLFEQALAIFNTISNQNVTEEVLESEKGSKYASNLKEVFIVATRIMASSSNCGKKTDELEELVQKIEQLWRDVKESFQNSSFMQVENSPIVDKTIEDIAIACGVCLLQVEVSKLSYGGRQYHPGCANLWVNCVDPLLPSLPLLTL